MAATSPNNSTAVLQGELVDTSEPTVLAKKPHVSHQPSLTLAERFTPVATVDPPLGTSTAAPPLPPPRTPVARVSHDTEAVDRSRRRRFDDGGPELAPPWSKCSGRWCCKRALAAGWPLFVSRAHTQHVARARATAARWSRLIL